MTELIIAINDHDDHDRACCASRQPANWAMKKSGVLNLGVEGMMLISAVFGFAAVTLTGEPLLGLAVGVLTGLFASSIFAVLTLSLLSDKVTLGAGNNFRHRAIGAFGLDYVGKTIEQIRAIYIPVLTDLPIVGRTLFMRPSGLSAS